jgi:DeoR family transcriptional regulator, glycerol-3-phosphate regulon repressor
MGPPDLSPRQKAILSRIVGEGAQQIEDLARFYGLTTQTIRRDINALCALGLARRFHGGVGLPVLPTVSAHARGTLNGPVKHRIAARIAQEIPAGATVFLGIGSTVKVVAEALRDHADLTIVTNNADVAGTLGDAPNIELHLTGGIWRAQDRDVVGPDAVKFFEKFFANFSVVGAGALHPANGVLDFSYGEAQITNAILENSKTRFLAADGSKWMREAAVRVTSFERLSVLVTDGVPEGEAAEALRQSGIDVMLCGAE